MPQTIGEHLKKKRLEVKQSQRALAERIGVSNATICNWENNRTFPPTSYIPRIISFLGYLPFTDILTKPLNEKVHILRKIRGLTQEELAMQIGVDPTTIGRWEQGLRRPYKRVIRLIDSLLIAHIEGN